jgi:hypothetical protein
LGFTTDGSFYFVVEAWSNDVFLADLDESGRLGKPTKLVSNVGYRTSVDGSSDGKTLA